MPAVGPFPDKNVRSLPARIGCPLMLVFNPFAAAETSNVKRIRDERVRRFIARVAIG
jgi:hypothetical protein